MKPYKIQEKRKAVVKYITEHPNCTCKEIARNTKIKIERIYGSLKEAYVAAGISLSNNLTKRNRCDQRKEVIDFIRNDPGATVQKIRDNLHVNITRLFGSITIAYQEANIEYPKRDMASGICDPKILHRCHSYEKEIISFLKTIGEVEPKVRTSKGIADCLFKYNNQWLVVEIKDFRGRNNISKSQIDQMIGYMTSLNIKEGFLICPRSSFPKRKNSRNLFIGEFRIHIISDEELRGRSISQILP